MAQKPSKIIEYTLRLFDICIAIIVCSIAIGASVMVSIVVVWFIYSLINWLF